MEIGVKPIQEAFLLKKAAQLKVYNMFDTNSHEHSVPQSYYLDAVGFFYVHSKEILYEGVGTLDKIFTYWDSKAEYHQAILDPQYCYGGFWTETRLVNDLPLNRTAMYLVSTVNGCNDTSSSSSFSSVVSSIVSSYTSTKTSTSTITPISSSTTTNTFTTSSTSTGTVTTKSSTTVATTLIPTNSTTSKKTSMSTPIYIPTTSNTSSETAISTSEDSSESSVESSSSESSSVKSIESFSSSTTLSTSSPTTSSSVSSSNTTTNQSGVNWRDLISFGLVFIVIVMGKFYYDVFYYFEK